MSKQLTAFTSRRTASSETKALQKAMGESEVVTDQYYNKATQRKLERIAAQRKAARTELFGQPEPTYQAALFSEPEPVQTLPEKIQYSLF